MECTVLITFNRRTALAITRAIRSGKTHGLRAKRCNLLGPDIAPRKRFTRSCLDLSRFGLDASDKNAPVDIAVPTNESRVRFAGAHSTIYGSQRTLPSRSFLNVGDGTAISCPELLFVEMATELELPQLVMLGFELCGSFSRDPVDPLEGATTYNVKPATTVEKIKTFLDKAKWLRGAEQAMRAVGMVADNAWAPSEAVIAAAANLPFDECGYGMGPCVLNQRVVFADELAATTDKPSRVPDILFGDTRVGINYDGLVHLDLESIANAGIELGLDPGSSSMQKQLDEAVRQVRAKVVDDIHRNRELAAAGFLVVPVTKEDLDKPGGLDHVMLQVLFLIEQATGESTARERNLIEVELLRARRQEVVWSLMPGDRNSLVGVMRRDYDATHKSKVIEVIIGF